MVVQRRRLARLVSHLAAGADDAGSHPGAGRVAAGPAAAYGGLLSAAQVESYCRDGFVLCSGLIEPAVLSAAVDSMWEQMAGPSKPLERDGWATPERPHPRRGDRSTWSSWAGIVDGPAIVATFTPALIAAAQMLADAYEAASPFPSIVHPIRPPDQTLAINAFPNPDPEAQWSWPGPHTDGAGQQRTEPRACRIQHMTFLTGPAPGEHGGGGTVAWPGCSRRLESVYMGDKASYEMGTELGSMVGEVCKDITPVEVMPSDGDVLFFDIYTGHSGSANLAKEPRLALNHKYGVSLHPKDQYNIT